MDCAGRGVLVVDDDGDIRNLVTLLLGDEGCDVRSVANGLRALEILSSWRPDVILLDLMMRVMDGSTFLAHQRVHPELNGIPVIVMSADRSVWDGGEQFGV